LIANSTRGSKNKSQQERIIHVMTYKSESQRKVAPIPGPSASRRTVKQLVITLVLSLPIVSFAQPVILIDNLFAPGEGGGIINGVSGIQPGTGSAVDFSTDGGTYSLNTLTLEFVLQNTVYAGFDAQIFTVYPSGSLDIPPSVNPVPYGHFGNPTLSPTPTQSPGSTFFINFTPTSPIILQPNTTYVVGFTEATNGTSANALRFGAGYTCENPDGVNSDYFSYTYSSPPTSPIPAGWSDAGYGGGPILSLTATEVPEPGSWALAAIAVALAGAPKLRTRFRFGQSNP
jgi:hypothetical protein